MALPKTLAKTYTILPFSKQKFYEYNSYFTFSFSSLQFWQIIEMKNFAAKTPFVLFQNYGFNGETKEGKGTLNISKLKEWTIKEKTELEEIIGAGIKNFWSFTE